MIRVLLAMTLTLSVPLAFSQHTQKKATSFPELDQLVQSREAGLVTDWNLRGPYGKHAQTDFRRTWAPERKQEKVESKTERPMLRFPTGQFILPTKAASGIYYASSRVYLFSDGDWNVWAESANAIQIFIDGAPVLLRPGTEQNGMRAVHESVHLSRGQHTVLAKFVSEAAPFRVAIMPPSGGLRQRHNIPLHELAPESLVLSASLR